MSTQDPATQEAEDAEGQLQAARDKSPEGTPGVDSSSGPDRWMQATVRNAARQVRQIVMGMSDTELLRLAGGDVTSQSSCQLPAAIDQGEPPAADQEHLQAEQGQLQAAAAAEVVSLEEPGMLFPSQSEGGFGATVDWGSIRVS